jgi:hypothetical protein
MMQWLTWRILLWATRRWGNLYMDQWTKFTLRTTYGPLFVSLERSTPWPDSFDDLSS